MKGKPRLQEFNNFSILIFDFGSLFEYLPARKKENTIFLEEGGGGGEAEDMRN